MLAFWLGNAYERDIRLNGIIYLHRISDNRVGGTTLRGLSIFKALCGEENYPRIVLASTRWDLVPPEKAEPRQIELCSEDRYWGDMVKGGSCPYTISDRTAAIPILKYLISKRKKKMTLLIQQQMVVDGKPIHETDAGKILFDSHLTERDSLVSKIEVEKERLKQPCSESHDQRQIAARDAIKRLKAERNIRDRNVLSLQVDMQHLNSTLGSQIDQRRKKLKQELQSKHPNFDLTPLERSRLTLLRNPAYTPSTSNFFSRGSRGSEHGLDGIQTLKKIKIGGDSTVSSTSAVVGTGLALGQFVAMLACTVM